MIAAHMLDATPPVSAIIDAADIDTDIFADIIIITGFSPLIILLLLLTTCYIIEYYFHYFQLS